MSRESPSSSRDQGQGRDPGRAKDQFDPTLSLQNTVVDPIFDYQFRLILIGDTAVGKSSLLRQFTLGDYAEISDPTVGVDFFARLVQVDDRTTIKLQLWDTAGQERFRSITKAYYRHSVGVVLVYDISDRISFQNVQVWMNEARKHIEPYPVTFVLVGCKLDIANQRQVSCKDATAFARQHGMGYFEASARAGLKVDAPFQHLAQVIYDKVKSGEFKVEDGWDGIKRSYFGSSRYHYGSEELPSTSVTVRGERVQRQNCC